MTAEGHLLFSISCVIFAKNSELIPVLVQGDWWHILLAAVLTCLLPDIDHPQSFLGRRIKLVSRLISQIFGHRGFTHSLLAVLTIITLTSCKAVENWMVPTDAIQGMILGYMSHIFADMLTPNGVPLFWPFRWRFRLPILSSRRSNQSERILCMVLLILSISIPKNLTLDEMVYWSSKMMHSLQRYIKHFVNLKIEF